QKEEIDGLEEKAVATGKEYLDFVAGIAVCGLGHSHPRVIEDIKAQLDKLTHVSNLYYIEPQILAAKIMIENSFADRVFFCNSGAEANEAAIKLARKYAHENIGQNKYELITMLNSFHGRTLAAIAATGQKKFHKGFEPLPTGFRFVPYNDLPSLEGAITDKTCGVMLEPIQGEGGVIIPDEGYLQEVRNICDRHGILMILDEVQVGMGRTGKLFAYEHTNIEPDILTLAKALGNGFPVGAMLAKEKFAKAFVPGSHASTFGGNPLAMAAVCATLHVLLKDGILENSREMGLYFLTKLDYIKKRHSVIKAVRGKGLMVAMELDGSGDEVVLSCLKKGLLINCTNGNILRFVPPLIISKNDIDNAAYILNEAISDL
ncbi:MAG: aspartate aminotransferase family protein, partial [Syntrophales bacterium LBB04]|nr:aspartate aminotransferase family protein [Syntrophales bacterium LBB04]